SRGAGGGVFSEPPSRSRGAGGGVFSEPPSRLREGAGGGVFSEPPPARGRGQGEGLLLLASSLRRSVAQSPRSPPTILAASSTEREKLPASAAFFPAMSNAVPWSGLVRTTGSPSVTFTAESHASSFTGINPWS